MPETLFRPDSDTQADRDRVAGLLGRLLARHWLGNHAANAEDSGRRPALVPSIAPPAADTTNDA